MNGNSVLPPSTNGEIAKCDIRLTHVSRGTASFLKTLFALTIAVPPLIQVVYDLKFSSRNLSKNRLQQRESQEDANHVPSMIEPEIIVPSGFQLFSTFWTIGTVFQETHGGNLAKFIAANHQLIGNIHDYERQLEEHSFLTQELLGPTRTLLARYAGVGNDRTEIGRDGWLFYVPEIEYLTCRGFLDPHVLSRHASSMSQAARSYQTDPRRAIVEFHSQLSARGIQLIVLPVPVKASIYPEYLTGALKQTNSAADSGQEYVHLTDRSSSLDAADHHHQLQNVSYDQFLEELRSAGVLVFDPMPALLKGKQTLNKEDLFLRTDTHWSPAGLEIVAQQLSEFIIRVVALPETTAPVYERRPVNMTNLGDLAVMLRLSPNQTLFPTECVTIQQIVPKAGGDWRADSMSEILLLGDSFTNIYSMPSMKWGANAGLSEQLSFYLNRPIECLAQNNGGAFATRQTLFQEMARGVDRLAGKRLVIWQFSARDLASGDWKLLTMPVSFQPEGLDSCLREETETIEVHATVQAISTAPRPGTVPYGEAIVSLHLNDVKSPVQSLIGDEIIVYMWGMKEKQPMNIKKIRAGQRVDLRIVPWSHVKKRYERFNRIELDDPEFRLIDLPIYWAESIREG